ncbi:hypothetical protein [Croceiramulus getboli]|nr:hypothetical protein P8624_09860 [Flavobacteriaceae bacterium YJPT1-3]
MLPKFKYGTAITVLFVILIGLNLIGYSIHQQAFNELSGARSLWQYLQSDLFKLLTISLVLPILLLLLENRLKIIENARAQRAQEAEKIKIARMQLRQEVLNSFISDWNRLFLYVNELRFYSEDLKNKKQRKLNTIQTELIASVIAWERNLNDMYYTYPKLQEYEPLIHYFINFMFTLATSSADHMKKVLQEPLELERLQTQMGNLSEHVKTVFFQPFMTIVKTLNRLDAIDPKAEPKEYETCLQQIQNWLDYLKGDALYLAQEEIKANDLFAGVETPPAREYHATLQSYIQFLKEHPEKNIHDFPQVGDFLQFFRTLDTWQLTQNRPVPLSRAAIEHLHDILLPFWFQLEISSRARTRDLDLLARAKPLYEPNETTPAQTTQALP